MNHKNIFWGDILTLLCNGLGQEYYLLLLDLGSYHVKCFKRKKEKKTLPSLETEAGNYRRSFFYCIHTGKPIPQALVFGPQFFPATFWAFRVFAYIQLEDLCSSFLFLGTNNQTCCLEQWRSEKAERAAW